MQVFFRCVWLGVFWLPPTPQHLQTSPFSHGISLYMSWAISPHWQSSWPAFAGHQVRSWGHARCTLQSTTKCWRGPWAPQSCPPCGPCGRWCPCARWAVTQPPSMTITVTLTTSAVSVSTTTQRDDHGHTYNFSCQCQHNHPAWRSLSHLQLQLSVSAQPPSVTITVTLTTSAVSVNTTTQRDDHCHTTSAVNVNTTTQHEDRHTWAINVNTII